MRTTLAIDDDILQAARCVADAERVSLGAAVSILMRRGLEIRLTFADDGLPVFDVPPGMPTITGEDVAEMLSDFP
ncbi:MAG: antitoxin [Dehalococcoidia bacterium]